LINGTSFIGLVNTHKKRSENKLRLQYINRREEEDAKKNEK
jgi:hypothetical protein